MASDADPFDPLPLLERLAEAQVDFVVIGGVAGGAHGSSYPTYDLDIAYARDRPNLEKLVALLFDLGATLRGAPAGLPFQLDVKTIENGSHFTFATKHGSFDLLSDPAGAPPYSALKAAATKGEVRSKVVLFASLDHLIAMKEAAGRTKDKLMATEYRVLSDELRAPKG
ncbi:hypothetical protein BH18ACT12_BH18ACT12_04290 [soil metagenome]